MSNKKYSLSYQLLEKKEMNTDEFLKRIKDSIPSEIPSDTESIQNFLNNTHVSNIISDLGKTKEEVIDDSKDLSDDSEYANEEYTILEVFNELNESNYEFNLTIPDLISNKKISLSFPAVLSLLYIINKSTPIKMQETKKHSLKKIIYEEKTGTVTQQIISAKNLSEFTSGMLKYIKQLNIPKTNQHGQIIKDLFEDMKFSAILDKIVKVNVENNIQFFTNMASDIGNLVEDTMLFKQTQNINLKPSATVAKTSLAILMLLKTQGSDDSQIIECRGSDDNWSISFNPNSSSGDFYSSQTFNSIKDGEGIKDIDYFKDIKNILIPESNFDKFNEAIKNVKIDSALIFDDIEANISITQVFTSKQGDSQNPAFDFIFKNKENKFSLIDLKTSNISSGSVGSFPKLGGNQDNSAINAIKDLPSLNGLEKRKPMFLGMLKMIYSLYIQSGSKNYFEFDSYMTSYGDVTSSCEHSLKEYEERKERRKTTSESEQKKRFFIHSNIEDSAISQVLKKYRYKSSKDNGIQSLSKEKIEELRKYFESRKYTISSLNPISVKEYTQKIDEYLQSHFKYFRRGGKIIITGIRFKFKKDLNPYDIPYFKKNPIEKGIDYLLATDISELEGLDDYHKSFFYDSNKLRVIKYFLKLLVDLGNAWSSDEYYNIVKNYYMDADKKVPSQDSVRKYKGNVYQKFLSKIAGETAAKNIKFSNKELKEKLINLLRIPDKTINNYLRYSDKSLKAREILENLDNFIEEEVNKENNEALEAWKKELEDSGYFEGPLYAHKEFKGKSLKEVYKDIF